MYKLLAIGGPVDGKTLDVDNRTNRVVVAHVLDIRDKPTDQEPYQTVDLGETIYYRKAFWLDSPTEMYQFLVTKEIPDEALLHFGWNLFLMFLWMGGYHMTTSEKETRQEYLWRILMTTGHNIYMRWPENKKASIHEQNY